MGAQQLIVFMARSLIVSDSLVDVYEVLYMKSIYRAFTEKFSRHKGRMTRLIIH